MTASKDGVFGKWQGVPLAIVLERASLLPTARFVVFHCADLYERHGNDLHPRRALAEENACLQARWIRRNAIQRRVHRGAWLIKLLCGYRGKEVRFKRQPGLPGKGRPICHIAISGSGPERGRRSWQCLRRDAAHLIGTIERNALARHLFHGRWRGMVLHRHLRAAVVDRGLRGIHTS
jgi:Oxidoreductase molybdopterin binding domain